jgi:hypothetical protein
MSARRGWVAAAAMVAFAANCGDEVTQSESGGGPAGGEGGAAHAGGEGGTTSGQGAQDCLNIDYVCECTCGDQVVIDLGCGHCMLEYEICDLDEGADGGGGAGGGGGAEAGGARPTHWSCTVVDEYCGC